MGHGNSGPRTTHGMIIVRALVHDQLTGIEVEAGPERLLDMFGKGPQRAQQFVVLTVTIGEPGTLYPNSLVRRSARRVQTRGDAVWALRESPIMRAIFVGTTKTLAITWTEHTGQPIAESIVLKVWLFIFCAMGWGAAMPNYEGHDSTEKLSDAVYLFPDTFNPPQLYFQMLLRYVNYEVYTTDIALTPDNLLDICAELQKLHLVWGGRTEIRTLGKIVYFDMAMWDSTAGFRASFAALANIGIKKVAQHPGKYLHLERDAKCSGIEFVTSYDVGVSSGSGTPA